MIAAADRIARFIATGDEALLAGAFAKPEVTIVENFAPWLFEGPGAAAAWAAAMSAHARELNGLTHTFGRAQDFSRDDDRVFFSLPTTWRGVSRGLPFTERGGWAFVLIWQDEAWRVRGYGWAVTDLAVG
jgi:hypothetical protein